MQTTALGLSPTVTVRGVGPVALGPALGEGAEGSVHAAGSTIVVKLYRPERLTASTIAKLELMLAKRIEDPRLAWPLALVEDSRGAVVGYAMPRAVGRTLQKSVFVPSLLARHFPRWTRLQLVELALALVSGFETLHRHGVLVGDVNGGNIVVGDDPRAARFVDLDSCQIGDFRSPVGALPFLAPRLLGHRLDSVSRTFDDECFAIATLLFMVLVPGKPPYSQQGGGDAVENIRSGRFPYELGAQPGDCVPLGPWAAIWSHLSRPLRSLFVRAFAQHGTVGPAEWRMTLESYRYDLLTGRAALDLFPAALRHEPVVSATMTPLVHAGDTDSSEIRTCVDCSSTFLIEPDEAHWFVSRGQSVPRRCRPCRDELRDAPSSFHVCKACSITFEITAREARTFAKKGLSTPKRCKSCRAHRRPW